MQLRAWQSARAFVATRPPCLQAFSRQTSGKGCMRTQYACRRRHQHPAPPGASQNGLSSAMRLPAVQALRATCGVVRAVALAAQLHPDLWPVEPEERHPVLGAQGGAGARMEKPTHGGRSTAAARRIVSAGVGSAAAAAGRGTGVAVRDGLGLQAPHTQLHKQIDKLEQLKINTSKHKPATQANNIQQQQTPANTSSSKRQQTPATTATPAKSIKNKFLAA